MKTILIKDTSNTKRANMKKALLSLSIIGLSALTAVQAQQTPLSNFYNFNEYLINPAQAGYRNQLEGSASHRIQWQGIEGAPKTTFFGVHGALNDQMGLGFKLNLDQTDILQQFNAAVSYAYRIVLNEKSKLHFGLSGIALQNSINYGDAVIGDYADDVINGGDQSGMTFDAEAGIMYEYDRLKVGISTAHLFESDVDYDLPENRGTGTFERVRQFIAYSSYRFDLNESWTLEPFVLIRNQGPESFQFEINALSTYNEMLYLGAGYRQEAGYIGRVGFQITDELMAAYAYEFGNNGVASYSNGSHEFMLGYNIGKVAEKKEPKIKKELAPEPVVEEVKEEPVIEKIVKEEVEPVIEQVPEPEPVVEELPEPVEEPEPEPIPEPAHSEEVEALFQDKIVFSFEGNKIPESIKTELDEIAKILVSNSEERVRVEGHTSTDGTDEQNQIVSTRRANLVKDYLVSKGVQAEQIETKAMLDRELLVPDNTLENKKINRRAEIELIR